MKRPVVFEYLDYRTYLSDLFQYCKEENTTYSYRFFARKAGFSSPNFLKLVSTGQRNLTNESAGKIAKGFNLKKQEREFFENLVFMNQAGTHEEKDYYYQKMVAHKGSSNVATIDKDAYEYLSKWYNPVIREVVILGERNATPSQIADVLIPKITAAQAEKSLNLLIRLGFIEKDKDGLWQQTSMALATEPEIRSILAVNFHKEMLDLATQSIDRFDSMERDITSLTITFKADTMPELKRRIASFRKELLNLSCQTEKDADQVIQLNFQAFPVAGCFKKEGNNEK